MREPSEAQNDVAMTDRVSFAVLAQSTIQSHRFLLNSRIFSVGKRQIKEQCKLIVDLMIEAGSDRLSRYFPRWLVSRVHAGRVPERVARELIEQDEKGERAVCSRPPVVQLTARGSFVQRDEACAEPPVKGRILPEPATRTWVMPESNHRLQRVPLACAAVFLLFNNRAHVRSPYRRQVPSIGLRRFTSSTDESKFREALAVDKSARCG